MKKILLFFLLVFAGSINKVNSQNIPNGDFENWPQADSIAGWTIVGGSATRMTELVQGSDTITPYSGQYFVGLRTDTVNGQFFPGILKARFAYTGRPDLIRAYMMFLPGSASVPENFGMAVILTRWNIAANRHDTVAYSNSEINGTGPNGSLYPWGLIEDSIEYKNILNPDSATIFLFSTRADIVSINTYLYIDKMEFITGPVGINEPATANVTAFNSFPNPAKENVTIKYNLQKPAFMEIKILDISGREVKSVYSGNSPAGEQQMNVDISLLGQGLYIYQVKAGETISSSKFIIAK